MDELQEFIIECKNQILQLTDNYLDNLKEINHSYYCHYHVNFHILGSYL